MPDSLLTNYQAHEIGVAILGGLSMIAAAIRQGFKTTSEKLGQHTEKLVRLETVVQEGRADAREVRDAILGPRRTGRRPAVSSG